MDLYIDKFPYRVIPNPYKITYGMIYDGTVWCHSIGEQFIDWTYDYRIDLQSYMFFFKHEADAIAFRLKFG